MSDQVLFIVVPCYNEEEVLPETTKRLTEKLNNLIAGGFVAPNSRILYVNDGSHDRTWQIIEQISKENNKIMGIKLSNNKGHQNALLAGLLYAKDHADMIISMDADLQDDINVIDEFINKYLEGNDIVYGVRKSRKKDRFFKRTTAHAYYRLLKSMGVDIIYNHADYRLMSRRAVNALEQFREVNLFLRGIVRLIGYNSAIVEYDRNERFAGESKYPLKKMLSLAIIGITSFSIKPIRFITFLGLLTFLTSIGMLIYFFVLHFTGKTISGWSSVIISIWAIGGLQLLCIGIIGEYVGRMYLETKARPKYFIEQVIENVEE